jgi:hypothetical protein
VASLSARLSGPPPLRDEGGSVLVPFTPDTPPDEAVRAVERALDTVPELSDWRARLVLSVGAGP